MTQLVRLLACLITFAGCSPETPPAVDAADEPIAKSPAPVATPAPPAARSAEALWAAALEGPVDAVRAELDAGVDVNATDPDDRTALMLAAFNGRTEIVRLLLDRGARVADLDVAGRTALMYASTGDFADTVELLLESGADPNKADVQEVWTPLMFAAGEGQMEVVRTLLRHGANPAMVDGDGDTAADHALKKEHEEVARVLQEASG
ncbi:MAG: ankyrin repeat domain-containing protein [bacterium]|nr:ankyrin repeat domain-containing protein [bacterium]